MLKTAPAVFAVEDTYQILVQAKAECMLWVQVGDACYYDESNGILRSLSELHRVSVPMAALDTARGYTVCVRPLVERKPYFTETAPVEEYPYAFRPLPTENIRAYHISDAHNMVEPPIRAARAFGDIDLLILNGDVIDHSGDPTKFDNIYRICDELTHGEIPVIFSRGNHDMRGNYAEKFAEYTPNHHGNTYYTFRLGSLWGLLLDCGEDKPDGNPEYGNTICCHVFRRRQTAFLQDLIARATDTYEAQGITTRVVIVHNPFSNVFPAPFDIEQDLYREWCTLLREQVKPHVMITGHKHTLEVWNPGCEQDVLGQPCPVVVGARPERGVYFAGCGYVFGKDSITVTFTDSEGQILEKHTLDK
ncbi:MAG: metallophosphoesterase [Clostridia bacterium]|nr:metallophosphoesterase [Clostridia bacterium]